MENFSIVSRFDGLEIKGSLFVPKGEVKGVFFISHGMCEHKERYFDFMKYLSSNGYVSVIHDHRGHGESVNSREDLGYFGDFLGNAIVEDLKDVIEFIKGKYLSKKVILLGHSMGSLVVRKFIGKYDDKIDKLIVCGSPSKNSMVGVALVVTNIIKLFRGEKYRSKLLEKLSTGNGDKLFPEDKLVNSWLCSDVNVVKSYNEDDLSGFTFTTNGYLNLFHLVKDVYSNKKYVVKSENLPIYFIAGSMDPVIKSEKKWLEAIEFLKSVGYKNITYTLYDGMRHEILNEKDKLKVYEDILKFIEV